MSNQTPPQLPDDARVLAVDVCGTLFDMNTSAGLVLFHHDRMGNRWRKRCLSAVTGRHKPLGFLLIAASKLTGIDFHRAATLFSLRGQARGDLDASAQAFLPVLWERRIDKVHRLVAQMQAEGWRPVLTSNSIDLVIAPIADRMAVPYLSSELDWDGDICRGRLRRDLTGRKKACLEAFLDRRLARERLAVITDNRSDMDLIQGSAAATLVAYGAPRSWMKGEYGTILHIQPK